MIDVVLLDWTLGFLLSQKILEGVNMQFNQAHMDVYLHIRLLLIFDCKQLLDASDGDSWITLFSNHSECLSAARLTIC